MRRENMPFGDLADRKPMDVLERFIGVFASKGWLNRTFRILHRDRRYRIFCSEMEFIAYRINDHCGALWGFPGWPVCIVTQDQIIEDADLSAFASTEPSVQDWLHRIAGGDFEIL